MLNLLLIFIGLPSILFAVWVVVGLYKRQIGQLTEQKLKPKWWLGVCADFSNMVGIPVGIIRLFILYYTPVFLGPIFYFLYYWMLQNRAPEVPLPAKPIPTITKIDSHHYP